MFDSVMCPIVQRPNGTFMTLIIHDGKIVGEEPTHPSQIRPARESLIWVPDKTVSRKKELRQGTF